MKKSIIAGLSFVFAPISFVLAQPLVRNVTETVSFIKGLLNMVIGLFLALGIFYVIWGIFDFIRSAGDEEKRKEGRDRMIYGIIGVAIMLSIFGLVNILIGSATFSGAELKPPTI